MLGPDLPNRISTARGILRAAGVPHASGLKLPTDVELRASLEHDRCPVCGVARYRLGATGRIELNRPGPFPCAAKGDPAQTGLQLERPRRVGDRDT